VIRLKAGGERPTASEYVVSFVAIFSLVSPITIKLANESLAGELGAKGVKIQVR